MSSIAGYCRIVDDGIFVNGSQLAAFSSGDAAEKLTGFYKQSGIEYPKFYKMDLLSKAAFLSVEMLKKQFSYLEECADDAVGLLFANSESSSDTDLKFKESYEKDQLPSPSLFVYTLPNIAIGEVAIRNKWYGANMFAVFPNFAPAYFVEYGSLMLQKGSAYLIGGWVDVREQLDVLFFLADGVMAVDQPNAIIQLESIYHSHRNIK